MKKMNRKKIIAILLSIIYLQSIFLQPLRVLANIQAPAQAEFTGFSEPSNENLVNTFSGDFNYNLPLLSVPGPHGGGYPLTLSYSNVTPSQEASWVGWGWSLSPGAINRNKQGFPDDVKAGNITYYNKQPITFNVSTSNTLNLEVSALEGIASQDAGTQSVLTYSNQKGLSYNTIPYINSQLGSKTSSVQYEDGEAHYSYAIQPGFWASWLMNNAKQLIKVNLIPTSIKLGDKCNLSFGRSSPILFPTYASSKYQKYSLHNNTFPTHINEYKEAAFTFSGGISIYAGVSIGLPSFDVGLLQASGGLNMNSTINGQKYTETSTKQFYGYLFSEEAYNGDSKNLMDYNSDFDMGYNLRNSYLPIPNALVDQFMVEASGLNGAFRAYNKGISSFRPNSSSSGTNGSIPSMSIGFSAGLDADLSGVGIEFGVTTSITNNSNSVFTGNWNELSYNDENEYGFNSDKTEFYFRFMGDMAGDTHYASDNKMNTTPTTALPIIAGSNSLVWNNDKLNNSTSVPNQSSFIAYHTFNEMLNLKDENGKAYKRFSYRSDLDNFYNDVYGLNEESIGEYSVVNADGIRYVFGVPVLSRNEVSLSYDINDNSDLIVYKDIADENNVNKKVGYENNELYANAYLLTEICGSNYIDRLMDGPTQDDYGSWVKFNYTKLYGANTDNGWYNWRFPYTGLINEQNTLSSKKDNLANYSAGQKEIYYVTSIETATHIAEFELSDRKDGFDSHDDHALAANDAGLKGNHQLKKLDRITLYAKDKDGNKNKVIKRVYFTYDYSLMQAVPSNSDNTGRLTLKKVWVESADVIEPTNAPYEFIYEYPKADDIYLPQDQQELYENILSFYNEQESKNQNPDYSEYNSDAWGFYQNEGSFMHQLKQNWVNQTPNDDFDPAAWQLKQIKIPGGSRILVQYQQDEYKYVQDRDAMHMINLEEIQNNYPGKDYIEGEFEDKYFLNIAKLGIDPMDINALEDYKKLVEDIFIDGKDGRKAEKMFFKFYYNLNGNVPDFNSPQCANEYIEGYAKVAEVGIENYVDGNKLWIKLGQEDDQEDGIDFPREACVEFYKSNRGHLFKYDCDENDFFDLEKDGEEALNKFIDYDVEAYLSNIEFLNELKSLPSSASTDVLIAELESIISNIEAIAWSKDVVQASKEFKPEIENFDYESICLHLSLSDSYLKVPIFKSKLGGGLRVAKLLNYQQGIEKSNDDDATLNGIAYLYLTNEGECSGVACNEPNFDGQALVSSLDFMTASNQEQIMAVGEDKSSFEGPIGREFLPSPSVGYSRVIQKNIFNGSTNTNFSVNEFYTSFDFPFDASYEYTDKDGNSISFKGIDYTGVNLLGYPDNLNSFDILFTTIKQSYYATQGYRVVLNGMNSMPKKQAVYSGDYNNSSSIQELSSTQYNYFNPGESVNSISTYDQINSYVPGRASDFIIESRNFGETLSSNTFGVTTGIKIGFPLLFMPSVNFFSNASYDQTDFYTHVSNEIIYLPTVLKSTTTFKDGAYSSINNEYFNPVNGAVAIQSTSGKYDQLVFNEDPVHNGKYYKQSIPASDFYEAMGPKAAVENSIVGLDGSIGKNQNHLTFDGDADNESFNLFRTGDLLAISGDATGSDAEIWMVDSKSAGKLNLQKVPNFYSNESSIIESVTVCILKSGKTNQLNNLVCELNSYGDMPFEDEGMISAQASIYSNDWLDNEDIAEKNGIESDEENSLLTAKKGKWYVKENYVYQADISGIIDLENNLENSRKIYNTGTFNINRFDWNNTAINETNGWLKTNSTVEVSPNGLVLSEKNSLNIKSVIKYGYTNRSLPTLIAQNASYESVLFGSYEFLGNQDVSVNDDYLCYEEDLCLIPSENHEVSATEVHSGFKSLNLGLGLAEIGGKLYQNGTYTLFEDRKLDDQMINEGILISFWAMNFDDYSVLLHETQGCEHVEAAYTPDESEGAYETAVYGTLASSGTDESAFESGGIYGTFSSGTNENLFESAGIVYGTFSSYVNESSFESIVLSDEYNCTGESLLNYPISFSKIATTGKWSLYQAIISPDMLCSNCIIAEGDPFSLKITYTNNNEYVYNPLSVEENIYLDDIRMQPINSKMQAFVYNNSNNLLLTVLDENNFGLYNQYNAEGKLIRNKRETLKGVKTITEKHYNIVKQNANHDGFTY